VRGGGDRRTSTWKQPPEVQKSPGRTRKELPWKFQTKSLNGLGFKTTSDEQNIMLCSFLQMMQGKKTFGFRFWGPGKIRVRVGVGTQERTWGNWVPVSFISTPFKYRAQKKKKSIKNDNKDRGETSKAGGVQRNTPGKRSGSIENLKKQEASGKTKRKVGEKRGWGGKDQALQFREILEMNGWKPG